MEKFTPGPWSVEDPMGADVGLWIVQSGLEAFQWSCIAIVTDDEDGTARDSGGRFIGRSEQEANARLIAAAPELVEALKAFLNIAAHCEIKSGVCGCGDDMASHADPMHAGHMPTDMADQVVNKAITDARAALSRAGVTS